MLLGWQFGSPVLKSIVPGLVAMNPATALGFILSGLSLELLHSGQRSGRSWGIGQACACAVVLLGCLKLVGISAGWDSGIDRFLFATKLDGAGNLAPNRMAPNTALNFVFVGLALLTLNGEVRRGHRPSKYLVLLPLLLSLLALTGYAYGVRSFYGFSSYIPMALNTALTFLLISTGILLAHPDRGLTRVFTSDDLGGSLARRLFPFAVGALLVLGWLRLQGERLGLYDAYLGGSLTVFVSSVLMGAVIWTSAHSLSRADGDRKRAADALRSAHDELESRVLQRTAQLTSVNQALEREATERKRAEVELRHSEARYRILVEGARDCVFTLSADGVIESVNPAFERGLGWTREEWLGRPYAPLVHPDDLGRAREKLTRAAAGETQPPVEFRVVTKSGEYVLWEVVVSPNVAGGPGYVLGVGRDVTERRRLEDQFRQAQKMEAVGRLAGGVAHDFNNLLTVIMGYTQLLAARTQPGDPVLRDAEEILQAATRAAMLTRQLLTFSRREIVQPRVLDLNALVADLGKMLRRLVGEDIEMVIAPKASRPAVKADPGQLEQVVMNLVVNARDAMPGGGRITIETSTVEVDEGYAAENLGIRPGPYVLLAVSDTGTGMDEATKARIFEPFFTTKEVGKGTGLGLSTVYGIVQQGGGAIHVYSDIGLGTTFKIYLPCAEGPLDAARAGDTLEEVPRGSETILIVEDQDAVAAVMRAALEACGYRILEARHGLDAARTCEEFAEPIHLLITDVVLPMMGGPELVQRVRTIRPQMRVLYVSGYTELAFASHEASGETTTSFLQKPFMPGALVRKVRAVLDAEVASSV